MEKKILKYEPWQYTPAMVNRHMSEKEQRKEYSRLRSIAQKRLQRLKAAGLDYTYQYKNWKNEFPTLKQLGSKSNISAALSRVAGYVGRNTTVTGVREDIAKELARLSERGFHGLTGEELYDFYDFMNQFEDEFSEYAYDSLKVMELYDAMKGDHSPEKAMEQFRKWMSDKESPERSQILFPKHVVSYEDLVSGKSEIL